ncbi:MAG: hypothetical protein RLZZ269_982, partial [Actinomycetota bacterium]
MLSRHEAMRPPTSRQPEAVVCILHIRPRDEVDEREGATMIVGLDPGHHLDRKFTITGMKHGFDSLIET